MYASAWCKEKAGKSGSNERTDQGRTNFIKNEHQSLAPLHSFITNMQASYMQLHKMDFMQHINMYPHTCEALEIKETCMQHKKESRKQNYTNTYGADGTGPLSTCSSTLLLVANKGD